MKKLLSLLLMAVMLCSMLAVFTVPAAAAEFVCDTWDDVADAIAHGGSNVTIILNDYIYVTYPIEIDRPCTVEFKSAREYYPFDLDGYCNGSFHSRAFVISGDDVTLKLGSIVVDDMEPNEEKGGAIYVTGDNCVIDGGSFSWCAAKYGGAIYLEDGTETTIRNASFSCNHESEYGAAIYANDDAVIDHCRFGGNLATKAGGAIYDNNDYGEVKITWCTFEDCYCYDGETDTYGKGAWVYGGGDAVVDYCTFSGGDTERYYYDCEKVTNSVGSTEPQQFIRPIASQYAQAAMANNENCDVIRRDENNPVKSDKEYVTLTAKTSDVFGWRATDDSPLTITAKEGYIITAIEGHVPAHEYNGARDYDYLIADHGKKSIDDKYVDHFGQARGDIDAWIKIDDIYSNSVSLTTQKDIYNRHTMLFDELIVYFAEDTPENRPVIEDVSTDYTRDGETYDIFTFDMNKASYTEPYITTSEQKGFTLTDTVVPARGHIYGWATKITITAPKGYTITRIEGKPVHFEGNVEFLKSNAGTIVNQGKPLAKDGIVRINDINASSIEISCTSDYVEFGEFLVFYEKNAALASVFSGGTLWVIIGVAAVAVAAAVVIVVVKKKKKPVTANGATAENSEE